MKTNITRILFSIGALLVLGGMGCLIAKALSTEYIDAAGVLHEQFFLLPVGFSFLFLGVLVLIGTAVVSRIRRAREHRGIS